MATYDELLSIATTGNAFIARLQVAAVMSANKIRVEANTVPNYANRQKWAKAAFQNSANAGRDLLWPVLTANAAQTSAAILSASDAAIQAAVDAAVDVLAQG